MERDGRTSSDSFKYVTPRTRFFWTPEIVSKMFPTHSDRCWRNFGTQTGNHSTQCSPVSTQEERAEEESGLSLLSLQTNVLSFCAVDASYPGQSHTCDNVTQSVTIPAASIHGSVVILCLATIIVSVNCWLMRVNNNLTAACVAVYLPQILNFFQMLSLL